MTTEGGGTVATPQDHGRNRLLALMRDEASRGGGTSYGADGRQARELGVSRPTIRRWKCQLERQGVVIRDGYHVWNPRCKTVRFRVRVTQGFSEVQKTARSSPVGRGPGRASTSPRRCGRRRRLMENHPDVIGEGIQRSSGQITPFNAGDAVGAAVDVCRELGIPLAPQIKARLGKGAKGLLEADFSPEVVVAACVHAVKTGWFGSVETIAQEMVVALAGERMGRGEHQRILAELSHQISRGESRVWQTMREEMTRRAERKEIE